METDELGVILKVTSFSRPLVVLHLIEKNRLLYDLLPLSALSATDAVIKVQALPGFECFG